MPSRSSSGGNVHLRSRNDNDFSVRYPAIVHGLAKLPDETVDRRRGGGARCGGRPSFNALQNSGSSGTPIVYYVFDVMMLAGRDLTRETLEVRRAAARGQGVAEARGAGALHRASCERPAADLIAVGQGAGFEGLVAKRRDSRYEPGLRSGAWMKMRVNQGQEFVIGGYTLGDQDLRRADLRLLRRRAGCCYAARTRNGFTPATRQQLFQRVPRPGDRDVPVRQPAGGAAADDGARG